MSLQDMILEMFRVRRYATVDDLVPELEGYTRDQVAKAVYKCREKKQLRCATPKRSLGPSGGTTRSLYEYIGDRLHRPVMWPATSPWDMAQESRTIAVWPPEGGPARSYQPLGGWTE